MAAFSHSLIEFLCQYPLTQSQSDSEGLLADLIDHHPAFDPHHSPSSQQDHRHSSPSPFSARPSSSAKFLSSAFFNPHHHDFPEEQHPHRYSHPFHQSTHSTSPGHQHQHQQQQQQQQQIQSNGRFINEFDDPAHRPSDPYALNNSPDQLMFIMPSFAKNPSNQLSLDGPSYAEPMLTSPYSDKSLQSVSIDSPYPLPPPPPPPPPPPSTATTTNTTAAATNSNNPQSHLQPTTNHPLPTATDSNPSQSNSKSSSSNSLNSFAGSSAITPPTTSSSRHPSEANIEELVSTYDLALRSKSHTPDPRQLGFSQYFKPPENPYSQSGFDLVGALARVVDRPDPKVKIGAVDTSAALVVVDARQNDLPIIFATPSFSLLTGYQTDEIIGQNCRFLQKPFNPNAVKRPRDQAVNCRATLQIRDHIQAGREIQSSIVNYRKDGKAFINLVTVIPIAWNSSEISHFVGFQADIVALTNGLGIPPSPKTRPNLLQAKQICASNTIEAATSQKSAAQQQAVEPISPSSSAPTQCAITEWADTSGYYQTVLQESRDLILAISLKGTLFYVSPSCKEMVGYDEEELVNQNISKICHPSDLTGILRQLKLIGNTSHTPIDLVFRAVDRQGEIFWMESQGQLHVEVGKGRKYIVVVGRPRTIGPLSWQAIRSAGGLGANEFWMKLSLDGLCLFATSPVREVLFYESGQMVGKSLAQMCAPEQRGLLINAIRSAYEGNEVVTLVYSLQVRNGPLVSVVSHFYPPHYSSGPLACGLPLPASKLTNPPRTIFCQTNALSSAVQRPASLPAAQNVSSSAARRASEGQDNPAKPSTRLFNSTSAVLCADPLPPTKLSGETTDAPSDDNLFSPLATTKTTPWNYEFSQLKRKNLKLRSELSQRGLSHHIAASSVAGPGTNEPLGCARTAKAMHAARSAISNPYPSRLRLHSTSFIPSGPVPEDASPPGSGLAVQRNPSAPSSFAFDNRAGPASLLPTSGSGSFSCTDINPPTKTE
ncbi:hypothetical protein PtB15_2B756 [Puccinia triticina]|nr:hypothetical protein PtB15_2B756 [Puccinia triticina]